MNKVDKKEQKQPKNSKQILSYKVKEQNINKMNEYLKKQTNDTGAY